MIEEDDLLDGCYIDIIVWSGMLAYQELSSPEDEGCRNDDALLDLWPFEIR